mmetsp:Transcript_17110/g.39206  ORF Transcript_17110/g.39206 Transcript_17110/m.39206 type:complete len:336 (-) Transcript_17110:295-1302(-)
MTSFGSEVASDGGGGAPVGGDGGGATASGGGGDASSSLAAGSGCNARTSASRAGGGASGAGSGASSLAVGAEGVSTSLIAAAASSSSGGGANVHLRSSPSAPLTTKALHNSISAVTSSASGTRMSFVNELAPAVGMARLVICASKEEYAVATCASSSTSSARCASVTGFFGSAALSFFSTIALVLDAFLPSSWYALPSSARRTTSLRKAPTPATSLALATLAAARSSPAPSATPAARTCAFSSSSCIAPSSALRASAAASGATYVGSAFAANSPTCFSARLRWRSALFSAFSAASTAAACSVASLLKRSTLRSGLSACPAYASVSPTPVSADDGW